VIVVQDPFGDGFDEPVLVPRGTGTDHVDPVRSRLADLRHRVVQEGRATRSLRTHDEHVELIADCHLQRGRLLLAADHQVEGLPLQGAATEHDRMFLA
jgi:hypothetical protein